MITKSATSHDHYEPHPAKKEQKNMDNRTKIVLPLQATEKTLTVNNSIPD